MRTPWSSEEVQRLDAMVLDGVLVRDIAAALGRSIRSTESAMYRHGIETGRNRPWTQKEIADLTRMVAGRVSRVAIAARLGRSRQAVNYRVHTLCLARRAGA